MKLLRLVGAILLLFGMQSIHSMGCDTFDDQKIDQVLVLLKQYYDKTSAERTIEDLKRAQAGVKILQIAAGCNRLSPGQIVLYGKAVGVVQADEQRMAGLSEEEMVEPVVALGKGAFVPGRTGTRATRSAAINRGGSPVAAPKVVQAPKAAQTVTATTTSAGKGAFVAGRKGATPQRALARTSRTTGRQITPTVRTSKVASATAPRTAVSAGKGMFVPGRTSTRTGTAIRPSLRPVAQVAQNLEELKNAITLWFSEGDMSNFFAENGSLNINQVMRAFNHIDSMRQQIGASVSQTHQMIARALLDNNESNLSLEQQQQILFAFDRLFKGEALPQVGISVEGPTSEASRLKFEFKQRKALRETEEQLLYALNAGLLEELQGEQFSNDAINIAVDLLTEYQSLSQLSNDQIIGFIEQNTLNIAKSYLEPSVVSKAINLITSKFRGGLFEGRLLKPLLSSSSRQLETSESEGEGLMRTVRPGSTSNTPSFVFEK